MTDDEQEALALFHKLVKFVGGMEVYKVWLTMYFRGMEYEADGEFPQFEEPPQVVIDEQYERHLGTLPLSHLQYLSFRILEADKKEAEL